MRENRRWKNIGGTMESARQIEKKDEMKIEQKCS